jgi:hypothetical protein
VARRNGAEGYGCGSVLRPSLALVTACVALASTGCGSSSSGTPTAATQPASAAATSTHSATAAQGSTGTRAATHPTATPTATRALFIARADTICRTLKSQQAPLEARVHTLNGSSENSQSNYKELASLLHQSVRFARSADAKLQALAAPPGDGATIEKLLAGYSEEAKYATSFADALTREERGAWEAAEKALARTLALDRGLAQGYGFKVCGTAG